MGLGPVAVPGVLIGALPWLLSNLRHDWWSVVHLPNDGVSYAKKLHGFVTSTFPMIIGLRVPFSTHWLLTKTGTFAVYVVVLALFAFAAWRWRSTSVSLFAAVVIAYPFIYSFGGLTSLGEEPRYVVLIVPAVVLLVAKLATTPFRVVAVLGVALALSVAGLTQWIDWRHDTARAAADDPHFVDVAARDPRPRAGGDRPRLRRLLARLQDHVHDPRANDRVRGRPRPSETLRRIPRSPPGADQLDGAPPPGVRHRRP